MYQRNGEAKAARAETQDKVTCLILRATRVSHSFLWWHPAWMFTPAAVISPTEEAVLVPYLVQSRAREAWLHADKPACAKASGG